MLNALLTQAGLLGEPLDLSANNSVPNYLNPNTGGFTGFMPPSTGNLDRDRQALLDILSRPNTLSAPPQVLNPAFRSEDALKGGLGLLLSGIFGGSKGVSDFTQGYLGGKQAKTSQDNQRNMQLWQIQNQNQEAQNQADLNVAKAKLGFSEDDYNRNYNEGLRQEQLKEKRRIEQENRWEKAYGNLSARYQNAKSLPDMMAAARMMRQIEAERGDEVSGVGSDEEIQQAWQQRSGHARDVIFDNWQKALASAEKGNYGTVTDRGAKNLLPLKKAMEAELASYGIEMTLPDPDTEQSLEAKYKAEAMANAKRKLGKELDVKDQQILESKARIQRAKERIDLQERGLAVREFNADTGRMNYELRRDIRQTNSKIDTKVQGFQSRIAGLKKQQGMETSPLKRQDLEKKIQALAAERDFWNAQKMEEDTPAPRSAGMTPDEIGVKAQQVRDALAQGKITKEEAAKLYQYLNAQGPMSR